jgi:hypothetical protein
VGAGEQLDERRVVLLARGAKLKRGGLGVELAQELDELEEGLRALSLRDALDHGFELLRRYDSALEAAEGVLTQRRARFSRAGRHFLICLVAGGLPIGWGLASDLSDYRTRARSCAVGWSCSARGECHLDTLYDGYFGISYRCVARSDEDCAKTCVTVGRCDFERDTCVPTEPQHCRDSELCTGSGLCSLRGEQCQPGTDAACARSWDCALAGKCSYDANKNRCVATSDDDCARASECAQWDNCVARRGECVPRELMPPDMDDCTRAAACVRSGFCDDSHLDARCAVDL